LAELFVGEASWVRRVSIVRGGVFFALIAAVAATALLAYALNQPPHSAAGAARPQPPPTALIAVIAASRGAAAAAARSTPSGIEAIATLGAGEIPKELHWLRIADLVVLTPGAVSRLATAPRLLRMLLGLGKPLLLLGRSPVEKLIPDLRASPFALTPIHGGRGRIATGFGDPEVDAVMIIPVSRDARGKYAARYVVYRRGAYPTNTSIIEAAVRDYRGLPQVGGPGAPQLLATGSQVDIGFLYKWYYLGEFDTHDYIEVPTSSGNIDIAEIAQRIALYYTPIFNDVQHPDMGLWMAVAWGQECTEPACLREPGYVVDSFMPTYHPIEGWNMEPNLISINVREYPDQRIIYEYPDIDTTGPKTLTLTAFLGAGGSTPEEATTFSFTIDYGSVCVYYMKGEDSTIFGGSRAYEVGWFWGVQTSGFGRKGSMAGAAHIEAPVEVTGNTTRGPLAPPGAFGEVYMVYGAEASIIDPGSQLVIPGVQLHQHYTYRFYASTWGLEQR